MHVYLTKSTAERNHSPAARRWCRRCLLWSVSIHHFFILSSCGIYDLPNGMVETNVIRNFIGVLVFSALSVARSVVRSEVWKLAGSFCQRFCWIGR